MEVPKGYLNEESAHRAKESLSLMQLKLTEMSIESSVSVNWFWYTLMIHTPKIYKALEVREQKEPGDQLSKLLFTFETIRVTHDGEILYRGPTIEEDLDNLVEELMVEIKRQQGWMMSALQRVKLLKEEEAVRSQALDKLHEDFPKYRKWINCYNKVGSETRFVVTLQDLTEEQLRTVIQMVLVSTDGLFGSKERPS